MSTLIIFLLSLCFSVFFSFISYLFLAAKYGKCHALYLRKLKRNYVYISKNER